jgi:hypothetical protein
MDREREVVALEELCACSRLSLALEERFRDEPDVTWVTSQLVLEVERICSCRFRCSWTFIVYYRSSFAVCESFRSGMVSS